MDFAEAGEAIGGGRMDRNEALIAGWLFGILIILLPGLSGRSTCFTTKGSCVTRQDEPQRSVLAPRRTLALSGGYASAELNVASWCLGHFGKMARNGTGIADMVVIA